MSSYPVSHYGSVLLLLAAVMSIILANDYNDDSSFDTYDRDENWRNHRLGLQTLWARHQALNELLRRRFEDDLDDIYRLQKRQCTGLVGGMNNNCHYDEARKAYKNYKFLSEIDKGPGRKRRSIMN